MIEGSGSGSNDDPDPQHWHSSVRIFNFSLEYYQFSFSLGRHDPRLAQRRLSEAAILPSIVQVPSIFRGLLSTNL
jgi:hypothetical protein